MNPSWIELYFILFSRKEGSYTYPKSNMARKLGVRKMWSLFEIRYEELRSFLGSFTVSMISGNFSWSASIFIEMGSIFWAIKMQNRCFINFYIRSFSVNRESTVNCCLVTGHIDRSGVLRYLSSESIVSLIPNEGLKTRKFSCILPFTVSN